MTTAHFAATVCHPLKFYSKRVEIGRGCLVTIPRLYKVNSPSYSVVSAIVRKPCAMDGQIFKSVSSSITIPFLSPHLCGQATTVTTAYGTVRISQIATVTIAMCPAFDRRLDSIPGTVRSARCFRSVFVVHHRHVSRL